MTYKYYLLYRVGHAHFDAAFGENFRKSYVKWLSCANNQIKKVRGFSTSWLIEKVKKFLEYTQQFKDNFNMIFL